MSELGVVGVDDPYEADRAPAELGRLQKECLVDLEDALVAVRGPDGKLRLKQSADLVGAGAATGGLWARCGAPRRALVSEPAARPGHRRGARPRGRDLSRSLADHGIDDDFIGQLAQTLQPNTSALFVLVREVLQPDKACRPVAARSGLR
jgi:uncharacterized membrane protein